MSLFHHISFNKVDPLANGLAEEIIAEQREPEAIRLEPDEDAAELIQFWDTALQDVENDPSWFKFTNE